MPARPAAQRLVSETTAAPSVAEASKPEKKNTTVAASNEKGEAIVQTALQYLGVKYRSGQSSPSGFDCSGLTSYVYRQEGISISRSSRTQYQEGTPVTSISNMQKGDLVFFGGTRGGGRVGHVGIVTEVDPAANKFKFVHASRTGVKVDESTSAYYSRRYIGARRIINN